MKVTLKDGYIPYTNLQGQFKVCTDSSRAWVFAIKQLQRFVNKIF
jgi:hypothetical protein